MRRLLGLALASLLLAAPVAAQDAEPSFAFEWGVTPEEVETTLYFHAINVQDLPINTQRPEYDASWQGTFGFGSGASTLTCLDPVAGDLPQGLTSQEFHTWYG